MLQALDVLRGPDANRPYNYLFFLNHIRFQYPPMSLLFLKAVMTAGISSITALNQINLAVYMVNAALIGALAWTLFRRRTDISWNPAITTAIAIGAALIFYPVGRALALGQIQVWIDLLFTGAMLGWVRGHRGIAGMLVGLACAIKPQFAPLLIWALLWREWGFGIGFVATLAPICIASLLAFGIGMHLDYLPVLSFLSHNGESYFANNSVNGILQAYFSPVSSIVWDGYNLTPYVPIIYVGTMIASILALLAIIVPPLLSRHRIRPDAASFGAATICTVIGSPVAWEHHYGVLLPIYPVALAWFLAERSGAGRTMRLTGLAISWALVANFVPFVVLLAGTHWRFLQAHFFLGGLLLLLLLVTRSGTHAPEPEIERPDGKGARRLFARQPAVGHRV
jgi:hypothetical protein